MFKRKTPYVKSRGIHLDLKGLPPSPKRLTEIVDILKKLRFNIILVEYNGMYPWKEKGYRFRNHYSKKTIKEFLDKSEANEISVIPLIQALGHMETALGLRKNSKYREAKNNPAVLCPLKEGSRLLVEEMIEDIMEIHEGRIEYFHLGGDEAWNFGSCPECRKYISSHSESRLYTAHYTPLMKKLSASGVRPMLWADMIRKWPLSDIRKMGEAADLVEWSYSPDPFTRYENNKLPAIYKKAGASLWGGSAFKGADGSMANKPDLNARAENNLKWTEAVAKYPLKGIIATGWSRYSDFTAQCESLEASLDSLALCASIMWNGKIPDQPFETSLEYVKKHLNSSKRAGKIIAISGELQKRLKTLHPHIDNFCRHHLYNSEPERINAWEREKDKGYFANFIKQIDNEILPEWKRLHKGLTGDYWINAYVKSRISYLRKIYSSLCEIS